MAKTEKTAPIPPTSASAQAAAAEQAAAQPKKRTLTITREEFAEHAKPMTFTCVEHPGISFTIKPREFSTGSYGWRNNDKFDVEINGKDVSVQIGANFMVIGSKKQ